VARPDFYQTTESTTLVVNVAGGVLANDTLNGATIVTHTSTLFGQLTLNANGSFTYIPNRHFHGVDGFLYTIENSAGKSTAVVVIDIQKS
jgi:VCBS repeat-containing protein